MLRFPRTALNRPLNPNERLQREEEDLRFERPECREKLRKINRIAVVGGGLAGLMAARRLSQFGIEVTVFEAHEEVGGRVRSNTTFSQGRITEEGAELIGSFHTKWLELARGYGIAMVSRMDPDLYHREGLDVKLTLDKPLSMAEFTQLGLAMEKRVLLPLALLAKGIRDPSRPWRQHKLLKKFDGMSVQDALPKVCLIAKRTKGNKDERLWKLIEFKLVNDEVAPLDEMNFLGLLCKVRAGQGKRFGARLDPILMGYWDELEIFRCGDGCQELARKIKAEINGKPGCRIDLNRMVRVIDIMRNGVSLTWVPVRDKEPDPGPGQRENVDFVILAIPPSVWRTVDIRPKHPIDKDQIGDIGMAPAVKFFSDLRERFWIKHKAAPYGGSLTIGQVWEGTDNQTQIKKREQSVVLSVFAGPILPGRRVPTKKEFMDELRQLYPDYDQNVLNTLLADWPKEPFIKTGYVSPKINQLLDIGEKLSKPFHDRLFFAGEHTRMDFFGYMEGALRSGERAAHTLMLKACGLLGEPAPKSPQSSPAETCPKPSGPALVARARPTRETTAFERESGIFLEQPSSTNHTWEAESPFLHQELFVKKSEEEWEPRAAALAAESPFVGALEERGSSFDEDELKDEEALDELEGEKDLETMEAWEALEAEQQVRQRDQEEDDSVDDEGAPLRVDDAELESPEEREHDKYIPPDDTLEPVQGRDAEPHELEFHSDEEGPLPELEEEMPSHGRIPKRSRYRIPEAGETVESEDEVLAEEEEGEGVEIEGEPPKSAAVEDALNKNDWKQALDQAIQDGWRNENDLTNLVFFGKHKELGGRKLDPKKNKDDAKLATEWSQLRDQEIREAIERAGDNMAMGVSGNVVAEFYREFRDKSGQKFKERVEWAAKEVAINPGLLATCLVAETGSKWVYLSSGLVSSYHIGTDDFYEGRFALKNKVPAYKKIGWDNKQTPVVHPNDAKRPRNVSSVNFNSGKDAVLATAVYLKYGEVYLREEAVKLKGDFDNLPAEIRFALTRMTIAAGRAGTRPYLESALKGNDILDRSNTPVVIYQTVRNATVRSAQALFLSEWIFGITLPAPVAPSSWGSSGAQPKVDESEFDVDT